MSKILATISLLCILVIMDKTTTFAAARSNNFAMTFDAPQTTDKVNYYIWGRYVMGAMPIEMTEKSVLVDKKTRARTFDISYSNDNIRITQVQLYVAGNSTMVNKVYVVHGGISQSRITLQVQSSNTDVLRYAFLVFGKSIN